MPKTNLTPPTVDQATIDHYIAKGQRERSRAFTDFFRGLFRTETKITGKTGQHAAC